MTDAMTPLDIRLLATTDLHAHLMNFDYYRDETVPNFGLVALADVIETARSEVPNTFLFDNGDLIQGNPLGDYMRDYALETGHPVYLLMNQLGYDAATLGNHEFNFGLPFLKTILPQANFPYLCANLVNHKGVPWITPYTILERNCTDRNGNSHPITIGVIGVLPPQITKWDKNHFDEYSGSDAGEKLTTIDIIAAVQRYLPELKAKGADIIMVLAHTGYDTDPYEVGKENCAYHLTTLEGIDVVIAGHNHRRFPSHDFETPHYRAHGFDLERGLINGTASVMAGSWSRYLGVIDLTLTPRQQPTESGSRWLITEKKAALWHLDEVRDPGKPINPRYLEVLSGAHEAARDIMNVPIGEATSHYFSYLTLLQDDSCVQIVADAQIYAAKARLAPEYQDLPMISAVPLFKVGSRKDDPTYFTEIPQGPISFKDIADLYVYPNQLVVLKLSGKNLREWLECCVSIYHTLTPNQAGQALINWEEYRSYNVDIMKGVEYHVDLSAPPRYDGDLKFINEKAHRISHLTYEGKPVTDEMEFMLATNSYRALVDRFPGAGKENAVLITTIEIPDVIRQFIEHEIAERGVIETSVAKNWHFDLTKLGNISAVMETSNHPRVHDYIAKEAIYPAQHVGVDPEGFNLFEFTLDPGN